MSDGFDWGDADPTAGGEPGFGGWILLAIISVVFVAFIFLGKMWHVVILITFGLDKKDKLFLACLFLCG